MNTIDMINSMLANAINPNITDSTSEKDDGQGNTMIVTSKVYSLVNHKKDKPTITIKDSKLVTEIERFISASKLESAIMYVKCKALANMTERMDIIAAMGYKTVGDFAHAMFGIAVKTGNQYARIGKFFINDDFSIREFPVNTNVSVMLETLAYVTDDLGNYKEGVITSLYDSNVLVDGMSTTKVRAALKAYVDGVKKEIEGGEKPALTDGKEGVKESEKSGKEGVKDDDAQVYESTTEALRKLNKADAAAYVNGVLDTVTTVLTSHGVDVNDSELVNAIETLKKYARNLVIENN